MPGPVPQVEHVSTFEIARRVEPLEGFLPAFGMAAYGLAENAAEQQALSEVRYIGDEDPKVALITAEEMLVFHESQGLPISRGVAGKFKDYFKQKFPDILPDAAAIPALPAAFTLSQEQTGARVVVSLGAGQHTLGARRVMQGLVHRFYDLDESDEAVARAWPAGSEDRGYRVFTIPHGSVSARTATGLVHRVVEQRPEIFPATLACGAVKVIRRGVYRPKHR